jgi:hypothetical protein
MGNTGFGVRVMDRRQGDAAIGSETPLRLEVAVEIAFPEGGMTVSGLRREASKGRLEIEVIAGKQFTTLRAIEEMRARCRVEAKALGCGSNQRNVTATASLSGTLPGSSGIERVRSARAALEKTARGLKERSPTTSPGNTESPASAAVIPLKSSS